MVRRIFRQVALVCVSALEVLQPNLEIVMSEVALTLAALAPVQEDVQVKRLPK